VAHKGVLKGRFSALASRYFLVRVELASAGGLSAHLAISPDADDSSHLEPLPVVECYKAGVGFGRASAAKTELDAVVVFPVCLVNLPL